VRNRQVFPAGRDTVFSRAGNYRRVWRCGTRRPRSTGFVRVLSYLEEADYRLLVGFQREMAMGKNAYSVFSRFAANLGRRGLGQCRVFRVLRWVRWPLREQARPDKGSVSYLIFSVVRGELVWVVQTGEVTSTLPNDPYRLTRSRPSAPGARLLPDPLILYRTLHCWHRCQSGSPSPADARALAAQ